MKKDLFRPQPIRCIGASKWIRAYFQQTHFEYFKHLKNLCLKRGWPFCLVRLKIGIYFTRDSVREIPARQCQERETMLGTIRRSRRPRPDRKRRSIDQRQAAAMLCPPTSPHLLVLDPEPEVLTNLNIIQYNLYYSKHSSRTVRISQSECWNMEFELLYYDWCIQRMRAKDFEPWCII